MKRYAVIFLALSGALLGQGAWAAGVPGSPDPAFQTIQPAFQPRAKAVQVDGRIVVLGVTRQAAGIAYELARYRPDGRPDPSFGRDGRVTLPEWGAESRSGLQVAVQADGCLLVLGGGALLRLLPGGQLDRSFGEDGVVRTSLPENAQALAPLRDGRVLIAGGTRALSPDSAAPPAAFALVRLLPDGRLDPRFGQGGQVTTPVRTSAAAYSLLPLPDGRVVVGGTALTFQPEAYGAWVLARYLPSGQLDPTFGEGGLATLREDRFASTRPSGLALDETGAVLAAGFLSSGVCDWVRVQPNGQLDPAWVHEISSTLRTEGAGLPAAVVSLALQPDGRALVGGCRQYTADPASLGQPVVLRLRATGQPDLTFGESGLAPVPDSTGVMLAPDGKIVVGLLPVSKLWP
ncbi:delta-60 repeat domain-containing protein [Deinococcus sp. YIM 77859]|uniref:delta-60 repeat domain-containing protein n=1 Tax=Deinococcus sp. YIM 77859 TaxID=1540221 RepID=UPI0005536AE2|nr:delta-60 repeat domain-containing protein [Deinococcus sp. YIM 77859]